MNIQVKFTPPGGRILPPPTPEDMKRDPVADSAAGHPQSLPWIRRAVEAERFAKALEQELNKIRAKKVS